MKHVTLFRSLSLSICLWLGLPAFAQGPPPGAPFDRPGPPPGGRPGGPPNGNPFGPALLTSEMLSDGKIVKGAPFSATVLTESVQVLADGTRISRKMSATFQRDSEGRTRREQKLESVGPFAIVGEPPHLVFINDVVANTRYVLNLNEKVARQMPTNPPPQMRPLPEPPTAGAAKTEALGKQVIEGLEAVGTRTTITIPTGAIGNDRPIAIVSERWEAPELQVVVTSKHSDPRVGETTYRLTNLSRTAPARDQFEIPADFKLVQETAPGRPNESGGRPDKRTWRRDRKP